MRNIPSHKLVWVVCNYCNRKFRKHLHHVEENAKHGHKFYCSIKCLSDHHKSGKWLICENDLCKKKFYKALNNILDHNYCSRSCAATVNNHKYPKRLVEDGDSKYSLRIKKFCAVCHIEFSNRLSKYCSMSCGKKGRFKYTKEEIIEQIKKYHNEHGRVPSRRDVPEIGDRAAHIFGSWNKTIQLAGFAPNRSHDHRMYKRSMTKANDGHMCDSISEATIDNWLTKHGIDHERNTPYPNTHHKTDWSINGGEIFIEYFGLAKDSPRYDRAIKEKKKLCKKFGIELISIYPEDLYPKNNLKSKFRKILLDKQINEGKFDFKLGSYRIIHSISL